MKRFIAFVLCCLLVISVALTGCGTKGNQKASNDAPAGDSSKDDKSDEAPVKEATNDPEVKVINLWAFAIWRFYWARASIRSRVS